jgi:hypothetical protein
VSPEDQDPALAANADESQHQQDADGPQQRAATAGPAGRGSHAIAGNNISNSSTGRGDIVGGNKTKKTSINFGAVAVIIGIAIGLLFAGKWVVEKVSVGSVPTPVVTKDSSCSTYLRQSPADRDAAIKRVGLELNVRGIGSPLMMPEVDYECGNSPNTAFGTVVGRQHGY